ncbi:MAG TPA: 16S rRNA (guanine(527)-N(7))-methyltransferase RsmG [Intrasporangium sp.]|uniref:16S rRNA (guanine(527)-N(7))-methyltransferase RsmG n=1 Tax=Intrasporangium sp. TaxID=1925024 RepID=UPI002B471063|nr:16S rRNA (guanine(527)-N(7))-methyltransferase RsmG [Intrasporangium sp.]HKX68481.1 16S rRNA (guanine(527)-N(7))-methyltransferase RsmG [Intrasporangium sp.]
MSDSEGSSDLGGSQKGTPISPAHADEQHGLIDGVPATPAAAATVFGEQLPRAEEFVRILADTGISHGLIGPREAPRLWDRHVLNCALVHYLIPADARGQRVLDIGSGAGLPGLALAIARPDLEVHLVEPLSRRTGWLSGVVAQLDLDNVVIHTARAESMWDRITAPWVTARAVSGIVQLAQWTLPLLTPRGSLLALKGSRAAAELAEHRAALQRLGVVHADVEPIGEGMVADPTIVLRVTIGDAIDRRLFRNLASSSAGSARRRMDRPRGGRSSGSSPRDQGRRAR